jgi:hypothetical protein
MPATAAAFQMNLARAAQQPDQDYSSVILQMRELSASGEEVNPAEQRLRGIQSSGGENEPTV